MWGLKRQDWVFLIITFTYIIWTLHRGLYPLTMIMLFFVVYFDFFIAGITRRIIRHFRGSASKEIEQ